MATKKKKEGTKKAPQKSKVFLDLENSCVRIQNATLFYPHLSEKIKKQDPETGESLIHTRGKFKGQEVHKYEAIVAIPKEEGLELKKAFASIMKAQECPVPKIKNAIEKQVKDGDAKKEDALGNELDEYRLEAALGMVHFRTGSLFSFTAFQNGKKVDDLKNLRCGHGAVVHIKVNVKAPKKGEYASFFLDKVNVIEEGTLMNGTSVVTSEDVEILGLDENTQLDEGLFSEGSSSGGVEDLSPAPVTTPVEEEVEVDYLS